MPAQLDAVSQSSLRSCVILVVDDEMAIRDLLMDVIEDMGYQVVGVEHVAAVLAWLHRRASPDVILLDLMMLVWMVLPSAAVNVPLLRWSTYPP